MADPAFLVGSAFLVLAALAFLVVPMMRGDGEAARLRRRRKALEELRDDLSESDYRERVDRLDAERRAAQSPASGSIRSLAVLLIVAVPLVAVVLYMQLGTPAGISPETGPTSQLREMLGGLAQRVRSEPDDVEAWNRLGALYKQLQQFPAAESAFRRVVFLDPENTLARVELAETLLYQSGQARLPEESDRLLREVLDDDPANQKALWLAGLGAYHSGNRERALAHWRRLEQLLPEGEIRDRVREQIASAAVAPDGSSPPQTAATRTASTAAAQRPAPSRPERDGAGPAPTSVAVEVSIDPGLAGRVGGSETVFVFARAVDGPPAPLAVKRLTAAELPTTIVLSDNDSMAEGLTLGTFPKVLVSARISRTGGVTVSSGDLEGRSREFEPGSVGHVSVRIDEIVE